MPILIPPGPLAQPLDVPVHLAADLLAPLRLDGLELGAAGEEFVDESEVEVGDPVDCGLEGADEALLGYRRGEGEGAGPEPSGECG